MNLQKIQQQIWDNKIKKGFNTTNIEKEFCLTQGELSECFDAYNKKRDDIGEELADVFIYLLALSKMLNVNLEEEIIKKVDKNQKREYKEINGVVIRTKEA